VTTVVKIGGSLSKNPDALRILCQRLSLIAEKHPLVAVPGGAVFADCVRELDKRFALSASLAHRMAILGMDQYGLLLSELMPNCVVTDSLIETRVAANGDLVMLLPSRFMFMDDGLPNSWDVTSDSIAAYIAGKIWAERLLLVKDVDGVFTEDPKANPNAKLIQQLTPEQLAGIKKSCVDAYLPNLLLQQDLDCFIVNGLYPERVEAFLNGQKTVGTLISPTL
jgi:5-(aminomethyl)-3-furanmethanol phosphate kinase